MIVIFFVFVFVIFYKGLSNSNLYTPSKDIKTTFFMDKFITMNSVQNEEYFNIRYQVKPFMLWIWISVLLISLGGLISLFKKKYEK